MLGTAGYMVGGLLDYTFISWDKGYLSICISHPHPYSQSQSHPHVELQYRHSKDLELRIPKHIHLVKIAHIRPEKIEFKVGRSKFKIV